MFVFWWNNADAISIEGYLKEKGTRNPLYQVNIYCFSNGNADKPLKTTSDRKGYFKLEVPDGKFKWVISVAGYQRFESQDEQTADKNNEIRDFYLERTSYLTYETTVYDQVEKRDDKTKSLSQSQFLTMAGSNGDPVKAIQNLPGVNRSSFANSQVIIEGAAPNDTRYNIDNQNVPLIFHFTGLSSVVIPEAIERVDYLSAGFGPEYGQSLAGLVNLTIKDPKVDRIHGFLFLDVMNAGGLIEGPIDDHSSFLFGFRQSYIGAVLSAAVGKNNKDFDFTVAPEFQDTVLEYKNKISEVDSFKIVGVGSRDTLGFLLKQPSNQNPAIRGNFNNESDFFRIIPEWTHHFSSKIIGRMSAGFGKDWIILDASNFNFHNRQTVLTGRAEIESQISADWKSYWGIDSQFFWSKIDYQLPVVFNQGGVSSPIGTTSFNSVSEQYNTNASGLYWRNVIHSAESPWTFIPGMRLSYFNLTREVIPEPRFALKFAAGDGWTLRGASGLYDQSPVVQNMDPNYGNPNLKSQRAIHGILGFEKDFRQGSSSGLSITHDYFYKYLYNMVATSTSFLSPSQPEYYNNSGYGHIYGLEVLGKYKGSNWSGWIAYTLSRSTRGDAITAENLFQYDQTHLLTAVGEVELGNNWKVSARIRYTSGNPYTPIVGGIFDANNDVYTPVRGDIYSQRMGAFFQSDLRFDKKWVYDQWILSLYLDIQNVTNQSNPQRVIYSYNYQQSTTITGLPFFPTLGVKAEF